MDMQHSILILFALGVVCADAMIRLRATSPRRGRYLESLISMLSPETQLAPLPEQSSPVLSGDGPTALSASLLKCFEGSFASRRIVSVLAEAPQGMAQHELEGRLADMTARKGQDAIPARAIRKVVMNLMNAELVRVSGGKLRATDVGQALHASLNARQDG